LVLAHGLGILLADLAWPRLGGGAFHGLALGCLLLVFVGRRERRVRGLAALVLAFAAGGASLGVLLDAAARSAPRVSREINLEAEVCGRVQSGYGEGVELCRAVEIPLPDSRSGARARGPVSSLARLPVRLLGQYSHSDPLAGGLGELRRGDRLRARVRIGPLAGLHNPGASDSERRWQRRGIAGRVRFVGPGPGVRIRPREGLVARPRPVSAAEAWVERVRRRIAAGLRGEGDDPDPARAERGGLLAALAVGDRRGLDSATRDAFARLGIAHILAISGLHLGLVAGLLFALAKFLLGWTGDRGKDLRVGALLLAGLGAGAYALLAGFGAPVRRALVFVWVGLAALHLARPISALHLLCGAWLVVVLTAPYALFELGTQLSFSATAALLAAQFARASPSAVPPGPLQRWFRRLRWLLHMSALALLATAPWLALRGLSPGLAGLGLNLLAIPWTSFALLPGALLAAAAVWLEGPAGDWFVALGRILAGLTLDFVGAGADIMPPGGPVRARPQGLALAVAAGLAVVATRLRETRRVLVVTLASFLWLTATPPAQIGPPAPRIVMLDVGQGDALLVQGRSAAVLIDAGRSIPGRLDLGRSVVAPALARLGVEFLDAVIVTHGDVDHRGGVPAILGSVAVGELWLPWGGRSNPAFADILEAARRGRVRVLEIGAGAPARRLGDIQLTPLWPGRRGFPRSSNAGSLVLRAQLADWRILMTGDIGSDVEAALLEAGVDLRADIMKVPHHGSAGSSSDAFLRAVRPGWLLLSARCGSGGLPHPDALARLEATGARLGWTGRDGAVALGLAAVATASPWRFGPSAGHACPEITGAGSPAWRSPHRNP
jgi:competence protein ComEC